MAVLYPSNEWCEAFCKAINGSKECAEKGKKWGVDFNGNFLFEIQPGSGLEKATYFYIEIEAGKCGKSHLVDDPSKVDHGFFCTADYDLWKKVVKGESDFIDQMIQGNVKLTGDMTKVVRNAMFLRKVTDLLKAIEITYLGD